jgi:flagellar basal-body rod modification protein FlgD
MPVNNTTGVSALSSEQLNAASRAVSNELGKDAFLRLLIAQLSNQDPLNPMDDREFIAQMAQFSSLEQMTNLNKTLESMASLDKYNAVSYVGKNIFFQYEGDDGMVEPRMDLVVAVFFDEKEGPMLETEHSGLIPLYKIDGATWI